MDDMANINTYTDPAADDLFAFAQGCLARFVNELADSGLPADRNLELRRGRELLCYYCLADGRIYLTLPDPKAPGGKLHALVLRSLMACDSDQELWRFIRLILPITMAHEVGHHLRHRLGLFGDDRWREEKVADRLAAALALRDEVLSPAERRELLRLVERQVTAFAARFDDAYQPAYTEDPAHYMYTSLNGLKQALTADRPNLDAVICHHFRLHRPSLEQGESICLI